MNFQVTVLKILVSYPDGFAVMADLKRDMAILATSGPDWAERTKRLASRAPDLDIFSQGLVERLNGGCRIAVAQIPEQHAECDGCVRKLIRQACAGACDVARQYQRQRRVDDWLEVVAVSLVDFAFGITTSVGPDIVPVCRVPR